MQLHVQGDPWCFQTDVSSTGTCRPDLDKADCGKLLCKIRIHHFLQLLIVGYLGITEKECMDRKCCWLEKEVHKYIYMQCTVIVHYL